MEKDNKTKNSANNKKDEKKRSGNEKREPNADYSKAVFNMSDRTFENKK